MAERRQSTASSAQHKVAQKYRLLGYQVEENPDASSLPEFMRDIQPDILARSPSDNVVVEVKERPALKGSNDLVGLAQRVAHHPDWRLELVVLPSPTAASEPPEINRNYERLQQKIQVAADVELLDAFYIQLAEIMIAIAEAVAQKHKISIKDKTDRNVFLDLAFKGVLPEDLTQKCLSVLDVKRDLAHNLNSARKLVDRDVQRVLTLCDDLEDFR